MSTSTRPVAMPLEQWPQADQHRWQKARAAAPGLFGEAGPAAGWRDATCKGALRAYGTWLAWLERRGGKLTGPDSVTPDALRELIDEHQDRWSGQTLASFITRLALFLRAVEPQRDVRWLMKLGLRCRRDARPIRHKAGRMVDADVLLALGQRLMLDGSLPDPPTVARAVDFRDGLMIALLAARPIRRANLAALRLGESLVKDERGYVLRFEPSQTKTRRPIEARLPDYLTRLVDLYLSLVRPFLLVRKGRSPDEERAVWITRLGRPMAELQISHRVGDITERHLGRRVNPHLFRDCVATTVAIRDPTHVGIAKDLLGHATVRSTERFYNQATSIDAVRKYQSALLEFRPRRPEPPAGSAETVKRPGIDRRKKGS